MEYKVVGVMFEITKKRYYFEAVNDEIYTKGEKVIVDTIRGQELGIVYAETMVLAEEVLVLPLKPVIRKATDEDKEKYNTLKKEAEEAFFICKKKIFAHNLPMKLVASEYTFDRTKLIFYFTAEGRIDFRDLVKDLAAIFKLRIELRQIGVRDESRILGCVGVCGKELCCRSFINKFDSVSIKMARDQGLVINPSKISGACGRLLCCIKYESHQYDEELTNYPAVGQNIETPAGRGRVINLNPLNGYMYVDVHEKGINRFKLEEIKFDKDEAEKMKRDENAGIDSSIVNELKGLVKED